VMLRKLAIAVWFSLCVLQCTRIMGEIVFKLLPFSEMKLRHWKCVLSLKIKSVCDSSPTNDPYNLGPAFFRLSRNNLD
jgi:hypothetical protein